MMAGSVGNRSAKRVPVLARRVYPCGHYERLQTNADRLQWTVKLSNFIVVKDLRGLFLRLPIAERTRGYDRERLQLVVDILPTATPLKRTKILPGTNLKYRMFIPDGPSPEGISKNLAPSIISYAWRRSP